MKFLMICAFAMTAFAGVQACEEMTSEEQEISQVVTCSDEKQDNFVACKRNKDNKKMACGKRKKDRDTLACGRKKHKKDESVLLACKDCK